MSKAGVIIKSVNIALTVMLLSAAAMLARELVIARYAKTSVQGPLERAMAKAKSVAAMDRAAYEAVSDTGLFGPGKVFIIQDGADEAPVSTAWRLAGTAAGKNGHAIFIDPATGKHLIIEVGEPVPGTGVLKRVYEDRVALASNGPDVVLYLPGSRPPEGSRASNDAASGFVKTGADEWDIDRRALDAILDNMDKVLTDARMLPYSEGGKQAGFRLSEIRQGGVFSLIGLRDGDVLLRINGLQIDSPEKGIQLLSGLRGDSRLSVDLLRDAKPLKLNFHIR